MTAFVLGNGVSRKGIDPDMLKQHGRVFGCNALYRDHNPHVLVSTDPNISREIQESGWPKRDGCTHWTRRPFADSGSRQLHPEYKGMSSGPNALHLAALEEHAKIYMLGMDLGSVDNVFNNVYAGTEHYKRRGDSATFGGNWFNQIVRIMNENPRIQFYRVVDNHSQVFNKLTEIDNLKIISKSEFQSLYK